MMENKSWLDCVKLCVGCGSLSVRCQFLISGIIFGVIIVRWIIIYIKAKKKNTEETSTEETSTEETSAEETSAEETSTEETSAEETSTEETSTEETSTEEETSSAKTALLKKPCRLLYWIYLIFRITAVFIAVILLVNAIITLSEAKHFVVESPLTYSDVILMLIGLAGDIVIAIATFMLQQKIDTQNKAIEKQKEEQKEIEEKAHQERLAQQQHHLWMAEHFGSIQSSSQTICKGTNLNINKEEKKDYKNGKLLIRVENRSDNGTYLFHPQYFSVKPKLTWMRQAKDPLKFEEKSEEGADNSSAFCLEANKLEIVFGEHEFEDVKNALLYPCSNISSSEQRDLSPQAFRFRLDITAEDRSYLINKNKKEMVYGITYTICFTLTQKSTYGYDDRGTFELVMSDYSISAEPPKPVEKGKFVAA